MMKKENIKPIMPKIIYLKKSFGKKFVDYLAPTNYNSMPLSLKSNIYVNKSSNIKKPILEWLFASII